MHLEYFFWDFPIKRRTRLVPEVGVFIGAELQKLEPFWVVEVSIRNEIELLLQMFQPEVLGKTNHCEESVATAHRLQNNSHLKLPEKKDLLNSVHVCLLKLRREINYPHQVHEISITRIIRIQSRFFDPLRQFIQISRTRHANTLNNIQSLRSAKTS